MTTNAAHLVDTILLEGLTPSQCIDAMINVPVRRFRGVDKKRLAGFDEGEVVSIATHPKYRKEVALKLSPGYVSGAKIPATMTKRAIERANLPLKVKRALLKKQLKRIKALEKLEKKATQAEKIRKKSGAPPFDPEKSAEWQEKMAKRYSTVTWRRKRKDKPPKFKGFKASLPEGSFEEQQPPMQQKGMSEPEASKAVDTELMKRQAEKRKKLDQIRREREQQKMKRKAEQDRTQQQAAQQAQKSIEQRKKQQEKEREQALAQKREQIKKAKEEREKKQKAAVKPVKEERQLPKRRLVPAYFYKRHPRARAGAGEGENVTFPGKAGPGV